MNRRVTKPTKWPVRPAKTQTHLGIRPVWPESSLSAWRKLLSLATQWIHSEYSEQTGRMPRLSWVFAGRTVILLILSRGGSQLSMVPCYTTHILLSIKILKPCEWFHGNLSIDPLSEIRKTWFLYKNDDFYMRYLHFLAVWAKRQWPLTSALGWGTGFTVGFRFL